MSRTMNLQERMKDVFRPDRGPSPENQAQLIVELTRTALKSHDIPSAVTPVLNALVERTAAVGSAYFQSDGLAYFARAASGEMPSGPAMDAILAHGLPNELPLLAAVDASAEPLFFNDTRATEATTGFPELGVASVAAAPVRTQDGKLAGAFLMHTFRPHCWNEEECELFDVVAGTLATLTARFVAEEQATAAREDALRALGLAVERRDSETKGHTDRVVELAIEIAGEMDVSPEDHLAIRWGSYLHDIGKIGIPDRILHKPGKLEAHEWEIMQKHAEFGHEFAERLGFLPDATMQLVLHHHEKWEGGGYPTGLSEEDIPLAARIFAVCDVFDALVSERPYKHAWPLDMTIREINSQSGRHFDPAVVVAFNSVIRRKFPHPGAQTAQLRPERAPEV